MKPKLLLFVLAFAVNAALLAQFTQQGTYQHGQAGKASVYYKTSTNASYITYDGALHVNARIDDMYELRNMQMCCLSPPAEDKITCFTPKQIKTYTTDKHIVYEAKEIMLGDTLRAVFVELLVDKDLRLGYYKDFDTEFYLLIKENNTYLQLHEKDKDGVSYIARLREIMADVPKINSQTIEKTKYEKGSISKLVREYNKQKAKKL